MSHRDPTANAAIGRVMRANRVRATSSAPVRPKSVRHVTAEYPDAFAGLLAHEARAVLVRALAMAGSIDAITHDDAIRARREFLDQ